MELSKRLQAVADLVTPGMRLADVGTDHGYIPIYLVEQQVIPSAIAMDINRGPLERAKEHIREHGLEEKISTRLSDGLKNLKREEAESMIAAGMGGGLVIKILIDSREVAESLKEVILQPQSEIGRVRKYLLDEGYCIVEEDMILEDGKYYPMMKAVKTDGPEKTVYTEEELEYGRILLKKAHPVLLKYLMWEESIENAILESLRVQESPRARERMEQVVHKIEKIAEIRRKYFDV